MGKHPEAPTKVATLLKKQKGKCTHCGLFFNHEDLMEIDHKIPRSKGGKDSYDNLQLLHGQGGNLLIICPRFILANFTLFFSLMTQQKFL